MSYVDWLVCHSLLHCGSETEQTLGAWLVKHRYETDVLPTRGARRHVVCTAVETCERKTPCAQPEAFKHIRACAKTLLTATHAGIVLVAPII